jgi:hypothetical protein
VHGLARVRTQSLKSLMKADKVALGMNVHLVRSEGIAHIAGLTGSGAADSSAECSFCSPP